MSNDEDQRLQLVSYDADDPSHKIPEESRPIQNEDPLLNELKDIARGEPYIGALS